MLAVSRLFNHYFSQRKVALFMAEEALVLGAAVAGATAVAGPSHLRPVAAFKLGVVLIVAVQACLYFGDLYDLRVAQVDTHRGTRLLRFIGVALVVAGLSVGFELPALPRGALLGGAVASAFAIIALRSRLHWVIGSPARVAVVGDGASARELVRSLEQDGESSFTLVGHLSPDNGEALGPALRELKPDAVVVACELSPTSAAALALLGARLDGAAIYTPPAFLERALRRLPVKSLRESDFIFAEFMWLGHQHAAGKRVIDLLAAVVLLVLAAPLMVLVALIVKLDSPGPLLYRQERVGFRGATFQIIKFRTMRADAEAQSGPTWAAKGDSRVTRAGKWLRLCRLDELPQIFAVLNGEMSLVGPRPERPFFVERLKREIPFYGLREALRPGVTGWAQIRYPYGASVDDARAKLEYDLYYLKNGSLFLDLTILFHTARHVLMGRGAR